MQEKVRLQPPSYSAFISYSHRDHRWGTWLHNGLETFTIPSDIMGSETPPSTPPKKIGTIFRDEAELGAAPDLSHEIKSALDHSEALIVVCSPSSAQSKWVNAEIAHFKSLGKDRVYALIIDGSPNASDPAQECFPEALKYHVDKNGHPTGEPAEPLAVDVRKFGREDALTRIVSGLSGIPYGVLKPREIERERAAARRAQAVAATGVILAALAIGASYLALGQARSAWSNEHQAQTSLSRAYLAQANTQAKENNCLSAKVLLAEALAIHPANAPAADFLQRTLEKKQDFDLRPLYEERTLFTECDHTLRATLEEEIVFKGAIWSLSFSPQSSLVAVGRDQSLDIVDYSRGEVTARRSMRDTVYSLDFHPRGNYLAAPEHDRILILDAKTLNTVVELPAQGVFIDSVRFSKDGRYLVATAGFNGFYRWEFERVLAAASARSQPISLGEFKNAYSLDTAEEGGNQLAIFGLGGELQVWDLGEPKMLKTINAGGVFAIQGVSYLAGRQAIVQGGVSQQLLLHNASTGEQIQAVKAHGDNIVAVASSPATDLVITAGWDGKAILWDAKDLRKIQEFPRQGSMSGSISLRAGRISPDGLWVATAGDDGRLRIWRTRQQIPRIIKAHDNKLTSLAFMSTGQLITISWAASDGSVKIWRNLNGNWIAESTALRKPYDALEAAKRIGRFAVAGDDDQIYVVALDGSIVKTFKEPIETNEPEGGFELNRMRLDEGGKHIPRRIPSVTISADGERVAWIGRDGSVRIGTVSSDTIEVLPATPGAGFTTVKYRPASGQVVTIDAKGSVTLWEGVKSILSIAEDAMPQAPFALGGPLSFSTDSGLLAYAGADGTIRIYDLRKRQEIQRLAGHREVFKRTWEETVAAVAFSSNGDVLISCGSHQAGGDDPRSVRVWRVSTGEQLYRVLVNTDVSAVAFTPDGESFAIASGYNVLIYPLNAWLWREPPKQTLERVEKEAGMSFNDALAGYIFSAKN